MEVVIQKDSFPKLLKKLSRYNVWLPQKKGDYWEFGLSRGEDSLDKKYTNTKLSPKGFIFPQTEVLFRISEQKKDKININDEPSEAESTVVFGVRPCDGVALSHLDKVFLEDFNDPYYSQKREKTIFIGLACETPPFETCSCTTMGESPFSTKGLDILLKDIGTKYIVEYITEKGKKLFSGFPELFGKITAKDKENLEKIKLESNKKIKKRITNLSGTTKKLDSMFDSDLWFSESQSCINCGICTYLCPSCHCFDINDELLSQKPLDVKRVRTWDNCQFPNFTMHSSGHNPRPDRQSRFRRRFYHKFSYFYKTKGEYLCTGCGRCSNYCPAGINIFETLQKVAEYE